MSKIKYDVFEINFFEVLQSKIEDLESLGASIEVTPIFNSNGEITKYFLFSKRIDRQPYTKKAEFKNNSDLKLNKFYG
jgi:hypothetical protein